MTVPPSPDAPGTASAPSPPAKNLSTPPASSGSHALFWLGAGLALLLTLYVFRDILLPFVVGITLAYVMNPVADWLEARGLNRTLAAALIVATAACTVIGLLIVLLPLLAAQAQALSAALPAELARWHAIVEPWIDRTFGTHLPQIRTALEKGLGNAGSTIVGGMASTLGGLLSRGLAVFNLLSLLLITPLVFFYLLVDWHRIVDTVHGWLPRDHAPTIVRLARRIDLRTAVFFRGQGTVCLLLGTLYAFGLTWAGIDYGALVGMATGLMGFVPIVGWVLGLATALLLTVIKFGFAVQPLAIVVGVLVLGLLLDTAVLSPKFVGAKLGLHPVWLIFALFAFSYMMGFVGTLVAVPLAAASAVLIRHALDLYLASDIYRGQHDRKPEPQ